jgi:hypothetical protein
LRELFVGSLIPIYARLSKRGFDIIPALGAGIDITQSVGCVLLNPPGVHRTPDNIRVKGLTLNNDGDRFAKW